MKVHVITHLLEEGGALAELKGPLNKYFAVEETATRTHTQTHTHTHESVSKRYRTES